MLKIINETRFFRFEDAYYTLKSYLLDNYSSKNKKINFLSLGCATGEEIYSFKYFFSDYFNVKAIGVEKYYENLYVAKEGIYVIRKSLFKKYSLFERINFNSSLQKYVNNLESLLENISKGYNNFTDVMIKFLVMRLNDFKRDMNKRIFTNDFELVKIKDVYRKNITFVHQDMIDFLENDANFYDVIQATYSLIYLPINKRNEIYAKLEDRANFFIFSTCKHIPEGFFKNYSSLLETRSYCLLKKNEK